MIHGILILFNLSPYTSQDWWIPTQNFESHSYEQNLCGKWTQQPCEFLTLESFNDPNAPNPPTTDNERIARMERMMKMMEKMMEEMNKGNKTQIEAMSGQLEINPYTLNFSNPIHSYNESNQSPLQPANPSTTIDIDDDHNNFGSTHQYINSDGEEILCFGSNHDFLGDTFINDQSISLNVDIQTQWDHLGNESYKEDPDSFISSSLHLIPPFDIPNYHPINESHIHKSFTHTIGPTLENFVTPQKFDQSCEPLIDDNKCNLIDLFIQNIDPQYNFNSISQFELEDMIYNSDTPIIPHPHESHVQCPFSNIDQVEMEAYLVNQILLYAINLHLKLFI